MADLDNKLQEAIDWHLALANRNAEPWADIENRPKAEFMQQVLDELSRLRSENASLREDISRYVSRDTERLAEVEKLREALKPFGSVHPSFAGLEDILWGHLPDDEPAKLKVKLRDLRRARAVLTGTDATEDASNA